MPFVALLVAPEKELAAFQPILEAACKKYVGACKVFSTHKAHDGVSALQTAVKSFGRVDVALLSHHFCAPGKEPFSDALRKILKDTYTDTPIVCFVHPDKGGKRGETHHHQLEDWKDPGAVGELMARVKAGELTADWGGKPGKGGDRKSLEKSDSRRRSVDEAPAGDLQRRKSLERSAAPSMRRTFMEGMDSPMASPSMRRTSMERAPSLRNSMDMGAGIPGLPTMNSMGAGIPSLPAMSSMGAGFPGLPAMNSMGAMDAGLARMASMNSMGVASGMMGMPSMNSMGSMGRSASMTGSMGGMPVMSPTASMQPMITPMMNMSGMMSPMMMMPASNGMIGTGMNNMIGGMMGANPTNPAMMSPMTAPGMGAGMPGVAGGNTMLGSAAGMLGTGMQAPAAMPAAAASGTSDLGTGFGGK